MTTDIETQLEKLERIVDSEGLGETLDALRDICFGKAEHIRANWQDRVLANTWERIGNRLDRAANETSAQDGTRKE